MTFKGAFFCGNVIVSPWHSLELSQLAPAGYTLIYTFKSALPLLNIKIQHLIFQATSAFHRFVFADIIVTSRVKLK